MPPPSNSNSLLIYMHWCFALDVRYHGIGIADSCELPFGCWELSLDPLEGQPVLLTTNPSLLPLSIATKKVS